MDYIKKDAIKFTIEWQFVADKWITQRIQRDSFHDIKHKMAAFHSMAIFMVRLPLSDEKVQREIQFWDGPVNDWKKTSKEKRIVLVSTFYYDNWP